MTGNGRSTNKAKIEHYTVIKLDPPRESRHGLCGWGLKNNRTGRIPRSYLRKTRDGALGAQYDLHLRDAVYETRGATASGQPQG